MSQDYNYYYFLKYYHMITSHLKTNNSLISNIQYCFSVQFVWIRIQIKPRHFKLYNASLNSFHFQFIPDLGHRWKHRAGDNEEEAESVQRTDPREVPGGKGSCWWGSWNRWGRTGHEGSHPFFKCISEEGIRKMKAALGRVVWQECADDAQGW